MSTEQTYEEQLRSANEIVYKHSLELSQLKKELERANQQQESLLHFMSHEVKGYLTKAEAAFAAIIEGDYGTTDSELRAMAERVLIDSRKGVSTIMDILEAANLKNGTILYRKQQFDLAAAVRTVVKDLREVAEIKKIDVITEGIDVPCLFVGDELKIRRHVIRNLVDNATRYTQKGSITISLSCDPHSIRFVIKDTGIGITPEDMPKLFTEGGHGKDSIKVNVDSTGYGLFVAKQVVEGHGGKISVESEGAGKGSKFTVELPVT